MGIRQILEKMKKDARTLVKADKEIEGLGKVYFRSLPGYYLLKMQDTKEDGKGVSIDPDLMIEMISNSACDDLGVLLFNTDEMQEVLKSLPMEMLDQLSVGVSEASGWGKVATEEIEKNSEAVV